MALFLFWILKGNHRNPALKNNALQSFLSGKGSSKILGYLGNFLFYDILFLCMYNRITLSYKRPWRLDYHTVWLSAPPLRPLTPCYWAHPDCSFPYNDLSSHCKHSRQPYHSSPLDKPRYAWFPRMCSKRNSPQNILLYTIGFIKVRA